MVLMLTVAEGLDGSFCLLVVVALVTILIQVQLLYRFYLSSRETKVYTIQQIENILNYRQINV